MLKPQTDIAAILKGLEQTCIFSRRSSVTPQMEIGRCSSHSTTGIKMAPDVRMLRHRAVVFVGVLMVIGLGIGTLFSGSSEGADLQPRSAQTKNVQTGSATLTTGALTMTGMREAPRTVTTGELRMTGVRTWTTTLTTGALTMTGVRTWTTALTTGALTMTGVREAPRTVTTGELRMTGVRTWTTTLTTGALTMTGVRSAPRTVTTGELRMMGIRQ